MFCDACGKEILVGQRFCSSCGKPAGIAVIPRSQSSRVAQHTHLLGILWLVVSAFNLIGAGVLFIVANTIFGPWARLHAGAGIPGGPTPPGFPGGVPFLQALLSFIAVLILIKAAAGFAAGIGLLQRQPWARVLALVLGFLALLNVPFGTALGIYTIWVLLSRDAAEEYRNLSLAA